MISAFYGKEAPWKDKVSFELWLFEVRSVQGLYSEPVLKETIIKLLKGSTAELMWYMGSQVEVESIILKLYISQLSVWC